MLAVVVEKLVFMKIVCHDHVWLCICRKLVQEGKISMASSAGKRDKYFGGGYALWDHLQTLCTDPSPCWFEGEHCTETLEVLQTLGQGLFRV